MTNPRRRRRLRTQAAADAGGRRPSIQEAQERIQDRATDQETIDRGKAPKGATKPR